MNSRKSDRNNLAIIGASGTGKTTLAVGLYATSTESFTVSPDGDETRKYLEIRKTSIEEGFWPAATNESENFDLRLRLHVSGKQTYIVFREYMGERMERDPNYIRGVIGTPKSAMILFNPGMPGLSKPETRNRMLGNLKVIAQHLKDNGCIAIAFVVTASDRLTSDLAAFREDFEAYASEVTNHLTNLGLEWKRFDVTVSGQLDDQNKPKLARGEKNTTHEPFLWLLKRIGDSKRRKYLLIAAAVAATILGVSGAVFGGLVIHSRQVLARAERDLAKTTNTLNIAYAVLDEAKVRTESASLTNGFDNVTVILPSDRRRKTELVNRANEQYDLWCVRLLRMEFTSNRNKIATKPSDVQLTWFNDFNKRLTASGPTFRDAVIERDTLTNEWTKSRSTLEMNCQTEHFRANVEQERKNLSAKPDALREPLLSSKKLIADEEKKYTLVTNRTELCARLELMTARTNAIVRFIDSKMGKPEDPNPPGDTMALCQRISKELKSVLTSEEFDKLPYVIEQRCAAARKSWEYHQYPRHVRKQLDDLKAASAAPADALKNSRAFLESMDNLFSSIPENKRSDDKASITKERADTIGRYLKVKTPWKPEDDEPPTDTSALQQQTRQDLKSALTDTEFEPLLRELETRRAEARKAWDAYHFLPRVRVLETALNRAGSNPTGPLRDSLEFLDAMTNNYPTISSDVFINVRHTIEAARKRALTVYASSITNKWDVNGKKPPEFDVKRILNTELTDYVITSDEANVFEQEMHKLFTKANDDWRDAQKKICDSFISRYLSSTADVLGSLNEYMEFRNTNLKNPFLKEVDQSMTSLLEHRLDWLVAEYYQDFRSDNAVWDVDANRSTRMKKAQTEFDELKRLCPAIRNKMLDGSAVQSSWVDRFASLCIEYGGFTRQNGINAAFQQEFKVSKIAVKVDFDSIDSDFEKLALGIEIVSRYWNEGVKISMAETLIDNYKIAFLKDEAGAFYKLWDAEEKGSKSIYLTPWTDSFVRINWEDNVNWATDPTGSFIGNIWSERFMDDYIEFWGNFNGYTKGKITVRVYGILTRFDLRTLLNQAKGNQSRR